MKKNFNFALVGAIALTGVMMFSACSESSEIVDNPDYDSEKDAVKTQFTISLPDNLTKTRQAASTVQEAQTITSFRGMQDIVLIPYLDATNRNARLSSNITLGANSMIVPQASNTANSIPSGELLENNNAVLYKDVTIPIGTSGFLFYGKATGTDGYANGSLTTTLGTADVESANIKFTPTPIVTTVAATKGEALATYVTSIAQAKDTESATWASTADNTSANYNAGLGGLYNNFISMKAGASQYVQAAVQDLYNSVRNNTDKISKAVADAITNSTYASADATTGTLTFTEAISNYPGGDNNSMPAGAAALSWSGNTATAVASNSIGGNSGVTPADLNTVDMDKVAYPASLYYFVNSGIKTSNVSRQNEYVSTNSWEAILNKYSDGITVRAETRSVAINDAIQYGVGRLDVNVPALLTEGTYYDRRGDAVTIPTAGFKLTGVLIGGQKPVNYEFEQISSGQEYTIYDNTINTEGTSKDMLKVGQAVGPTYTMALETAANQEIYVVLEFENSGDDAKDFMGVDGVVKKGCKFYMVAKLTPTDDTDKVSGSSNTGNKVFKQDYKTIVNFTIGQGTADINGDGSSDTPGGFGNAYVTIPDLRTPQLELGFSVNLEWQQGITFNVTI